MTKTHKGHLRTQFASKSMGIRQLNTSEDSGSGSHSPINVACTSLHRLVKWRTAWMAKCLFKRDNMKKKNSIDQTTIWGVSDNATLLHSTEIKHTVIFSNMIFGSLHSNCKSYLYSFNIFGRAAEWSYSRYASFYLINRNLWNESWKEMNERCLVLLVDL